MSFINSVLKAFVGDKSKKDVKQLQPIIAQIKSFEEQLERLSHNELRDKTNQFKAKIKENRKAIDDQIEALN